MIAKNDTAREVTSNQMVDYLNKYLEKERENKKLMTSGVGSVKDNFEALREKIKMFFNMDSSAFYQDLKTFDTGKENMIKHSDFIYYLVYSMGDLADNERNSLNHTFRAVGSTLLSIDYITSMIFYGKANIQTLNKVEKSKLQNIFCSQVRSEINLKKLSSFDVYQNCLGIASSKANEHRQTISENDLQAIVDAMGLGMSTDEIEDLFRSMSNNMASIDYRTFRMMLYGKELVDLTGLVFKVDERLRTKQLSIQDHFYQYGQGNILFKEFANRMLDIDPSLKYDEIDILFCSMDKNANLKVSVDEFLHLMTKYATLNDFKTHLVTYARNRGKELSDILYLAGNTHDGLRKDEFKKLVKDVTEGQFTDEESERLFTVLDRDNDKSISKTEMSEILDLAQKQLYNVKEFLVFRNAVIDHCQSSSLSIQELYGKYAEGGKTLTKAGLNRMISDIVKHKGADRQLIQSVLDSNMSDTIDIREFKSGIIGPDIDVDALITNIRRMLASSNTNIDEVFNRFDSDRRGTLDFFEFVNFLQALSLRLTFVEIEKMFDVLAFSSTDHIKKQEFFDALAVDPSKSSSSNIIKVIEDFKDKVSAL